MATDHHAADSPALSTPTSVRELKDVVRAAAFGLRHAATQGAYRGLQRPERAYALASVLDLFEIRWAEQDPEVLDELLRCCRVLLTPDAAACDGGPLPAVELER
ncbi:hypothetical protein Ae717Ps2_6627c [Pseudonocardia sp. Ae717_Ps2]|uniref:hypothetical protein n=1 Tax=Pseudonocardia sp. Ae717_Ps2 TaxID=1885573 RepID=UPI00094AEB24|nr:hypothetical protein [Pseudonocardia sp. Ae717_Ps2]OLM28247.1 hypothetical protein Ae717Ps2_6586c [Pseudonocardia sp. Ae717_Ps2]OLM28288.1 hypothetical protein Ae717Ps2_6627c [Pseudonocardia sp. Ae717_Ps2]